MEYKNKKKTSSKPILNEPEEISADVVVIGAGAAGLMSAIAAARCGASVAVLEHTPVSGKKLLTTGNGRCNFTNALQNADCYHSDDPELVIHALQQFSEKNAISFFESIGVYAMSKNGYFYPRSGQASAIRDALILETKRCDIRFFSGQR